MKMMQDEILKPFEFENTQTQSVYSLGMSASARNRPINMLWKYIKPVEFVVILWLCGFSENIAFMVTLSIKSLA